MAARGGKESVDMEKWLPLVNNSAFRMGHYYRLALSIGNRVERKRQEERKR